LKEDEFKKKAIVLSVTLHRDVLTWLVVIPNQGFGQWMNKNIIKVRQYSFSNDREQTIRQILKFEPILFAGFYLQVCNGPKE